MRIISFIFFTLIVCYQSETEIKSEWSTIKLPKNWTITINKSADDYFNYGNLKGQLIFRNKSKKIVYYVYDKVVSEKLGSEEYSNFFKNKDCQPYSSWKEMGFPNFEYNNRVYVIDLCSITKYSNQDQDYDILAETIFNHINKRKSTNR